MYAANGLTDGRTYPHRHARGVHAHVPFHLIHPHMSKLLAGGTLRNRDFTDSARHALELFCKYILKGRVMLSATAGRISLRPRLRSQVIQYL
jgi:hypothetical protein